MTSIKQSLGFDAAELQPDDPRPDVRVGAITIIVFFGLFMGWAAFFRLDAAATAAGQIVVSGHRVSVQSRNPGVVDAIRVRDGQHVREGDPLIDFTPSDIGAAERTSSARVITLLAQRAQLRAERSGSAVVATPPEFATLPASEQPRAQAAMTLVRSELAARLGSINSQRTVLRTRGDEIKQQIRGYTDQIASIDEQQRLLQDELAGMRELAARGYAPQTRVREIERQGASLRGSRGSLVANIAQAEQQIGEMRSQELSLVAQRMSQAEQEQRDVESRLADAQPQAKAAAEHLSGTRLTAPTSGTVVGLTVFSAGAVAPAGERLLDIVPDDAPLVIQARIRPTDADDLTIGMDTQVRFVALHERRLPIIHGRLTSLSADALVDERTGGYYYLAEVTVPPAGLAQLTKVRTNQQALRPGLPVQVIVPLRKRTALQYLLEPLVQAFSVSFHES